MHSSRHVLWFFLFVLLASTAGAFSARLLSLPAVVGEIFLGGVIGPYGLGLVSVDEILIALSEIAAVFLLFSVGLETRFEDLKSVGKLSLLVAFGGVVVPFFAGLGYGSYLDLPFASNLFFASAMVATSAGITARVLQEMGILSREESRIILGAAVIDDILAMLVLGFVTSFQSSGSPNLLNLFLVLLQAVAFLFLATFVGTKIARKTPSHTEKHADIALSLSLLTCLSLAVASSYVGLAAIIGAFLAGSIVAETEYRHSVEHQMRPINVLIVPFFFIGSGAQVDLSQLGTWEGIKVILTVTVIASLSKLVGCALAMYKRGWRQALIVGAGMVPRGEVGIVVASLGKSAGVFTDLVYSAIVCMSLFTSLIGPLILRRLMKQPTVA